MYFVVNTNDMLAKLAGLAESIEYRVNLLLKEQKAIADGAAGLFLSNPLKKAAFSALASFEPCSNKKRIEKRTFSNLKAQQIFFVEALNTVQTANDRKFILLGSEISKIQQNVKAIRDVV